MSPRCGRRSPMRRSRSSPRTLARTTGEASISFSTTGAWKSGRCARDRVSSNRPRVLIVDDSAFMRRITSQIVSDSGEFEVAGVARNGIDALKQIHQLDPDIVTLDIEMPELDGLNALGYIMSETPRPVVMLSAANAGRTGAQDPTLRALELGAVDFVLKPSGPISLDL